MSEHIVPTRTYYLVYVTLMFFTFLTWWVAYYDLGALNTVAALAIACTKMVLVILFFMHVKYATRLTWLVIGAGFFWLAILLALTFGDYLMRGLATYG